MSAIAELGDKLANLNRFFEGEVSEFVAEFCNRAHSFNPCVGSFGAG